MKTKTRTPKYLLAIVRKPTWRLALSLLAILLVAAACSSSDGSPNSRQILITADDGTVLRGQIYGRGAIGIVLVHEAEKDQGQWSDFATSLSLRGFTVVTVDLRGHGNSPGPKELGIADSDAAAALRFLRVSVDVQRSFLMGAGVGGTAVIKLASRETVVGVITLSAPASARGVSAVADAPRVVAPILYLAAEGDGPAADDAQDFFERSTDPKTIELFPGDDHGVELLKGAQSTRVRSAINEFLDQYR